MRLHRSLLLLAVTLALVSATPALAQAPLSGPTAGTLARGGAGIALTNEHATGLMNPAALTMLTRLPSELPGEASTPSGETAWGLPARPDYGGLTSIDLRRPARDEQIRRLLSLAGDGGQIALAPSGLGPTGTLPQAIMGPTRDIQVSLETRFLALDQDWLRDVGIDWRNPVVFQAGYDFNFDTDWDFDAFQAVGGEMNDPWAFALGHIDEAFHARTYLSAAHAVSRGRLLAMPRVMTIGSERPELSVGTTLSYHSYSDPSAGGDEITDTSPARDSEITLDIGALVAQDRMLVGAPVRTSAGVMVHDVFNSLASPGWDSRELGIGLGATAANWRLGLDLVPVLEDQELRTAVELKLGDSIVISGALREGDGSWGVRGKVPFLKDIPVLSFFYGRDEREERAGLMILITPHIVPDE